jgi:hypothetical protein
MSDVVQKWLKLKYPEQFTKEVYERTSQLIQDSLRGAGVMDEAEQSGKSVDEVIDDRGLKAWQLRVKEYDTSLLDELEMSPKELFELIGQKASRSFGGKQIAKHLHNSLDLSLAAFLEVERENGSHRDAVNRALRATQGEPYPPDGVTVKNWLNQLIEKRFCCSIPAAQRGRPKKKSN